MIGTIIKQVRKELKITQLELSAGKIARNLISEIENGNTRLISKNAYDFIQQFLYYSLKKKIQIDLDNIFSEFESDIEIDKLKGVHTICNHLLNYKNNKDNDIDLDTLDSISSTVLHNMLRYELYISIAEIYNSRGNLENYLNFKLKGFDILVLENQVDDLLNQLNQIRPTMLKLNKNHSFVTICIMSINIFKRNNFDFNVNLYYYISICYLRMNLFDDSIKYIDLYLYSEKNKSDYCIGLLQKANIYSKSNSYTIARDLYSQASILLLHSANYLNYSVAISNIIDLIVYSSTDKNTDSIDSIKYYCSLLDDVLDKLTMDNVKIRIQSKLALGLSYIDNNIESKEIFDSLLASSNIISDATLLANILSDSIELYSSLELLDVLEEHMEKLLALHEDIAFDDYCEKLILRYIQLNLDNSIAKNILSKYMNLKYSHK